LLNHWFNWSSVKAFAQIEWKNKLAQVYQRYGIEIMQLIAQRHQKQIVMQNVRFFNEIL
jgi:predicted AAA+ superfamily ATPase